MNNFSQYVSICEGKTFKDLKKGNYIYKLFTDIDNVVHCIGGYKIKKISKATWDTKSRTTITYTNPVTNSDKELTLLNTNMENNFSNNIYSDSDIVLQIMYNELEKHTRRKQDAEKQTDSIINNIKNAIKKCQNNI